jgi:hypothetical protein
MRLVIVMVLAGLLGCAGSGGAGDPGPLRREETEVMRFEATVKAVDLETRLVTLTDASGGEAVFHADEAVKNLPQVRAGDEVVGQLAESVVLEVREATAEERAAGASILEVNATAPPGEKPAGRFVRQIVAVLTIEAIDAEASTATLRGPAGNLRVVPVRDRRNLERVKVGDTVVATYTEALSLKVRAGDAPPN